MDYKIAFSMICTRTSSHRFILGKTYNVYYKEYDNSRVIISKVIDENSYNDTEIEWRSVISKDDLIYNIERAYRKWYNSCNWCDYSFKLVINQYEIELL